MQSASAVQLLLPRHHSWRKWCSRVRMEPHAKQSGKSSLRCAARDAQRQRPSKASACHAASRRLLCRCRVSGITLAAAAACCPAAPRPGGRTFQAAVYSVIVITLKPPPSLADTSTGSPARTRRQPTRCSMARGCAFTAVKIGACAHAPQPQHARQRQSKNGKAGGHAPRGCRGRRAGARRELPRRAAAAFLRGMRLLRAGDPRAGPRCACARRA